MGLLKSFEKKNKSWAWFFLTFAASFLPVILRFIIGCDGKVNMFDIKDFLFAGLALNLANLNWVGSQKFPGRDIVLIFSAFLMLVIGSFIGILMSDEKDLSQSHMGLVIFSIPMVVFSAYLSFESNNYIFESVQL